MSSANRHALKQFFYGWSLTRFLSVLLLLNVTITLSVFDINEKETIRFLIRSTAKCSFILFMFAFVASSLHHFLKNPFTKWLLANRRYIGVSFAISHYLHLSALVLMTMYIDFNVFEDRGVFRTAVGATAYLFMTLMTLTSFDRTRNLFGEKNWKRIHTIGGYLLWVIFAKSYILDMSDITKTVFAIIAVAVLILRIFMLVNKKKI